MWTWGADVEVKDGEEVVCRLGSYFLFLRKGGTRTRKSSCLGFSVVFTGG